MQASSEKVAPVSDRCAGEQGKEHRSETGATFQNRSIVMESLTVGELRAVLAAAQPRQADEARAILRLIAGAADHEPMDGWAIRRGPNGGADEDLIAAIGYREILPGVAEAWAVFTRGCARRELVVIGREMAGLLAIVLTETGERTWPWRRVQTLVRTREHAWLNWLQKLGFRREGVLREYALTGEDMVILAVTRRGVGVAPVSGRCFAEQGKEHRSETGVTPGRDGFHGS